MNHLAGCAFLLLQAVALAVGVQATVTDSQQSSHITGQLQAQAAEAVKADNARITAIFKDIHQHPELAFRETRTASLVTKELKSLGFEVNTGIGVTGVMAMLRNGAGPTVLYRADMDANPVQETTHLSYASTVRVKLDNGKEVPVAHACGHDAHVSWMLGMAHAMVELKSHWSGTLILVAQPAEELIAGAQAMVDDGLYDDVGMPVPDFMLAMHTAPIPVGTVVSAGGVRYAGTDQIDVTFYGVGGHGSMPQYTKDPVLMAASAVVQYQSIVARTIDPQSPAVLTVGSIQSGTQNNVIPDKAVLKINLRWFSKTVRQQLISGIKAINHSVAIANNLPEEKMPVMTMKGSSRPLINDEGLTARLSGMLASVLDERQIMTTAPATMASEDAHLLLANNTEVPVAYLFIGVADPLAFNKAGNRPPYLPHNGDYLVELEAIPFGTQIATLAVLELLANSQ